MRTSKRYSHAKNVKKNSTRHIISRMPRRKYVVVSPMPLMVNPQPLNCLEIYFNKEPVSILKPGLKCCKFDPSRSRHTAVLSLMDQKGHARPLARQGVSPTTTHLSTSPMSGRRVSPATSRLRTSPTTSQKMGHVSQLWRLLEPSGYREGSRTPPSSKVTHATS